MPFKVRKLSFCGKLAFASAVWLGVANFCLATPAQAAWVRGKVKLNLRTGPGTQYRILGLLETGEEVNVVSRQEDWTEVRVSSDGKQGFILAGFLDQEPPPSIKVLELESRTKELIAQLTRAKSTSKDFSEKAHSLERSDNSLREQIKLLTDENASLRSPSRWPEWITGALILSSGIALGAILKSILSRNRRQHRIKL